MKSSCALTILTLFLSSMVSANILKSPEDDKEYRYLVLDNAMKVLLVSDPTADKAGVSLDVHIGSGSDPEDWAGLAHFLEHMLFLGTRKYPESGEYKNFISTHGGFNNAYTSFAHTNYFFSVGAEYLEPAMDRFSQFFLEPLFDPSLVDSERAIIESEYQSLKKDEFRRLWDVQKSWLNPEHPASRFSVGTLKTLRDREGVEVRDKLIWFYETYYSANLMALAVVGKDSLDQLEQWATEKFSGVRNNEADLPSHQQSYFNQSLIPARIDAVPEKDLYSLSFLFPVPSTYVEYQSKPLSYISHLLGHEGPGSLLDVLKDRGWVESLRAGPGYMDLVQGSFAVSMNLTQKGLEEIANIGELLFGSIKLISEQGIEQWRFAEQTQLSQVAFRYAQESDPGRLAQSLSSRLHRYPPEEVLIGPYIMDRFDPARIRELLQYLTPDNVNIRVVAPGIETDQASAYYNVQYRLSSIDDNMLKHWMNASPSPSLALPEPNQFIPSRLELLGGQNALSIPARIDNPYGIDLWHQYDDEFGDPRANLYIKFLSPVSNQNPKDRIMTEVYVRTVVNQLSDIVYDASLAGLSYELFSHYRGITLKISGFEEPQKELLRLILEALVEPDLDMQNIEIIRHSVERALKNIFLETPANQSIHEIYRVLMVPYWDEHQRLDVLHTVDAAALQDFLVRFYRDVQVVMLYHGDVSPESSLETAELVNALTSGQQPESTIERIGLRQIANQEAWLRTVDIDHSDAALSVYFQGFDASLDERARMTLLAQLLRPLFYHQIRTVNEVGYLVFSGSLIIEKRPGLFFAAQSSTYSPEQIFQLYYEFLIKAVQYFEDLSTLEFAETKKGLISQIMQKPLKLSDRTSRLWKEIDDEEFDFNSREMLSGKIDELTLDDIQAFYKNRVLDNSARLIVQSAGTILRGLVSGEFVPIDSVFLRDQTLH